MWIPIVVLVLLGASPAQGQTGQTGPAVRAFPPFKIIGNIYYVGDTNEAVYLMTTPAGHIMLDTGYAETVPIVKAGVEQLGFRMTDIKIMISGTIGTMRALFERSEGNRRSAMRRPRPPAQRRLPTHGLAGRRRDGSP